MPAEELGLGPLPAGEARQYIVAVQLPGSKTDSVIELAYPTTRPLPGVINVLCGENNTGKSHILKRIREVLYGAWSGKEPQRQDKLVVRLSQGSRTPKVLLLGKTWREKAGAGRVDVGVQQSKLKLPGDVPAYRMAAVNAVYTHLSKHIEGFSSREEWMASPEARTTAIFSIPCDSTLYRCVADDPVVRAVEIMLSARLYLRRSNKSIVDFMMLSDTGLIVPYSMWSDGQQAIFLIANMVLYEQPDVLLLDEIENHFHPTFMTKVLAFCREHVPQTLVSTHHPHIIFSEFADEVCYLEIVRVPHPDPAPATLEYRKHQLSKSPRRRVHSLRSAFDKLTAIYKLFEPQDRELLKQAQRVASDLDMIIFQAILATFHYPPVAASSGPLPDRQTGQVLSVVQEIAREIDRDSVRVLDIGSGFGRLVRESAKVSSWRLGANMRWTCWEPFPKHRTGLRRTVEEAGLDVCVPDNLGEVPDGSVDLCVVANVLHELTPPEFADVIYSATNKLEGTSGALVIVELYPLLHPEKYAVPYPAASMIDILQDVGFRAYSKQFSVRDSAAYAAVARPMKRVEREQIVARVEGEWHRLLRQAGGAYSARQSVASLDDYQAQLGVMTVIASVTAWREGWWQPGGH